MSLTWKNGALLFLCVLTAAALGCALALRFFRPADHHPQLHAHAHEVLQRDLGLSPKQVSSLETIEQHFLDREAELKAANARAVSELADALERDRAYSSQVDAIITEIHEIQGELQKATIEHLLEMEAALTPEQFEKLLKLVTEALRNRSTGPSK
tara:strand:+ start:10049 stop:10513 length:465 start_codon:yes stop_codon:yes gene_type:complete